jgi:hypothetical protein
VRLRLEAEGKWRAPLVRFVDAFFFRARELGDLPRLEAVYGDEITRRNERVARRAAEREKLVEAVRQQAEANEILKAKVYEVTPNILAVSEARYEQRRIAARIERKRRVGDALGEASRAAQYRQEKIAAAKAAGRDRERRGQLDSWLGAFRDARRKHIEDWKRRFDYRERDDEEKRAVIL